MASNKITLKTPQQIEKMRSACRIVRDVLDCLGRMIAPGVTMKDLDDAASKLCDERGAECLFRGVPPVKMGAGPFPGAICASPNEVVVHGIPSANRVVRDGDIVSVDFGVRLDGWCGDAAETYIVGAVPDRVRRLVSVTKQALNIAVAGCRPGERWSRIARKMQTFVENEGFSVVRDFVGHGIGSEMHEAPKVPNFVTRDLERKDIFLREGIVLAIEPMVNMGSPAVEYGPDGWAVVTRDRLPSAHFEHTVAVTSSGPDILTK